MSSISPRARHHARAACLLLVSAQAACLSNDLNPDAGSPFSCVDGGECPSGYRCAQALCIAEGYPDPPLAVASSALTDAPPIPLWNGSEFAAVWQDTTRSDAGLFFARLDAHALGHQVQLMGSPSPVTLSALYERTSKRYVIAAARNDLTVSKLEVVATDGDAAPQSVLPTPLSFPSSPVGFSRPALSSRQDGTITLAYTRGDPPMLASRNLYCTRISLVSPGAATDPCGPTASFMQFASEVVVAEFPAATLFQWKADATYLSIEIDAAQQRDVTTTIDGVVHTEKMINANQTQGSFAVVGQFLDGDRPTWQLRIGDATGSKVGSAASPIASDPVVPDVDGDGGDGFVVCKGDPTQTDDLGAWIVGFHTEGSGSTRMLVKTSDERRIPRYSHARIESCHIAVAKEAREIGVMWRERVPPAAGKIYFTTMPLDP